MRSSQSGFTLVEIIVAIVVMSIISVGLVSFITDSSAGYVTASTRNQVSSAGRVVLDRLSMELRNALPESVRVSTPLVLADQNANRGYIGDQCIEFIPVRAATTYINPAIRPAARKASFSVVDFVPSQLNQNGVYAVVYPTSLADLYGVDLTQASATEAIARVNVSDGPANTDILTYMTETPLAYNHRFKRTSSVERLFLTDQPVSYCITGSKLYRYKNYGFTVAVRPPIPEWLDGVGCTNMPCLPDSTPDRELITDQVDNTSVAQAFQYLDASRRRNAIIQIELNFSQDGEEVRLSHEVLQPMTP